MPPVRPVWPLLVICVTVFSWCLPESVQAQYRGGRELPEEDYLGRKGVLFATAGTFYCQPTLDYKDFSRGAGEHGFGWNTSIGAWMTSRASVEFEWGGFLNHRRSDLHPFSRGIYSTITNVRFENTYWQAVVKYHMRIEKRVIPYLTVGVGWVYISVLMDSSIHGYLEQINMISGDAIALSFGLGTILVLREHVAFGLECRSLQWSTSSTEIIPYTTIWGTFRLGMNLSWHF